MMKLPFLRAVARMAVLFAGSAESKNSVVWVVPLTRASYT